MSATTWLRETAWPAIRKVTLEALDAWGAGVRVQIGPHAMTLILGLIIGAAFAKLAL